MNPLEILMISVGLSFDVYAVSVCKGAMLARVEKKTLMIMGAIFCMWQVVAVMLGNLFTLIPLFRDRTAIVQSVLSIFSAIIFLALATYMLIKAWKRKSIFERCEEINYKEICLLAIFTSIDAFFAGIGFGFLQTEVLLVECVMIPVTIVFVVLGVFTGYRLGYEQKTKAYGIGGGYSLNRGCRCIFKILGIIIERVKEEVLIWVRLHTKLREQHWNR